MSRKFAVLTATMLGVALTLTGFSMADDDDKESPLKKAMEVINAKHKAIRNATKTPAAWKKEGKGVLKSAEEVSKQGKEARKDKHPSEVQKKSYDEWTKIMDDMIKSADDLAEIAAKPNATQVQAKEAYTKLNKTCADCHNVFRVEEEK